MDRQGSRDGQSWAVLFVEMIPWQFKSDWVDNQLIELIFRPDERLFFRWRFSSMCCDSSSVERSRTKLVTSLVEESIFRGFFAKIAMVFLSADAKVFSDDFASD